MYAGNGVQGNAQWSNFALGHPRRFGVIRGNLAADERIFTKFGVYMDSGT